MFALSQNIGMEWGEGVLNRSAGTTQSSWCFTMSAMWNLSDPVVRSFALTSIFWPNKSIKEQTKLRLVKVKKMYNGNIAE